jgi:hypothetical protein
MSTEKALMLMDQDVARLEAFENSLVIEYEPAKAGFSLFYNTFEGCLHMKTEGNCLPQEPKPFKISFMIEGQFVIDPLVQEGERSIESIKETIITVRATKMDIV